MSNEDILEIPESGGVFTFGKSRFAENIPSYFFVRKDPIIDLCCGDEHTVIICKNGRAFSFGRNSWGELGVAHRMAVARPHCIKYLKPKKCIHVSCGRAHTLILTENGQVFSSGNNDDGQLGLQDVLGRDTPNEIQGLTDIKQLSAGSSHSAALTAEGEVYVWGSNKEGQLGLGNDLLFVNQPTLLVLDNKIDQIACGYYHTILLTDEGNLLVFGEGEAGKLGVGDEMNRTQPTCIKSYDRFKYVAAGGNHSAAITVNGRFLVWGSNEQGQLGLNAKSNFNEPTWFTSLEDIISQVSCGENHTAIVTENGKLYTFGDNSHGKLCMEKIDGKIMDQTFIPIKIKKFDTYQIMKVKCGGCHTMVLAAPKSNSATSHNSNNNKNNNNALTIVTSRKEILVETVYHEIFDTESTVSSKSSSKASLPPLPKFTRNLTNIPSPPPSPTTDFINSPDHIPVINTIFSDNEPNDFTRPETSPRQFIEENNKSLEWKNMIADDSILNNDEVKVTNIAVEKEEMEMFLKSPVKNISTIRIPYEAEEQVSLVNTSQSYESFFENKKFNGENKEKYICCLATLHANIALDVNNNVSTQTMLMDDQTCGYIREIMATNVKCLTQTEHCDSWLEKLKQEMCTVMDQIETAKTKLKILHQRYDNILQGYEMHTEYSFDSPETCSSNSLYGICCPQSNTTFECNNVKCVNVNNFCKQFRTIPIACWTADNDNNNNNNIGGSGDDTPDKRDIYDKKYGMTEKCQGNGDVWAAGDGRQILRLQPSIKSGRATEKINTGNDKETETQERKHLENYVKFNETKDKQIGKNKTVNNFLKIKKKIRTNRQISPDGINPSYKKSKMCTIL